MTNHCELLNLRVLIVDDEITVADGVRAYFEDEGIEVMSMDSAEAAIEMVSQGIFFNVCIMDMRLTGIDGNNAIRILAQLNPNLRFLIHTGSAGYVIPDDLRNLGITNSELFFKPQSDIGLLVSAAQRLVLANKSKSTI